MSFLFGIQRIILINSHTLERGEMLQCEHDAVRVSYGVLLTYSRLTVGSSAQGLCLGLVCCTELVLDGCAGSGKTFNETSRESVTELVSKNPDSATWLLRCRLMLLLICSTLLNI